MNSKKPGSETNKAGRGRSNSFHNQAPVVPQQPGTAPALTRPNRPGSAQFNAPPGIAEAVLKPKAVKALREKLDNALRIPASQEQSKNYLQGLHSKAQNVAKKMSGRFGNPATVMLLGDEGVVLAMQSLGELGRKEADRDERIVQVQDALTRYSTIFQKYKSLRLLCLMVDTIEQNAQSGRSALYQSLESFRRTSGGDFDRLCKELEALSDPNNVEAPLCLAEDQLLVNVARCLKKIGSSDAKEIIEELFAVLSGKKSPLQTGEPHYAATRTINRRNSYGNFSPSQERIGKDKKSRGKAADLQYPPKDKLEDQADEQEVDPRNHLSRRPSYNQSRPSLDPYRGGQSTASNYDTPPQTERKAAVDTGSASESGSWKGTPNNRSGEEQQASAASPSSQFLKLVRDELAKDVLEKAYGEETILALNKALVLLRGNSSDVSLKRAVGKMSLTEIFLIEQTLLKDCGDLADEIPSVIPKFIMRLCSAIVKQRGGKSAQDAEFSGESGQIKHNTSFVASEGSNSAQGVQEKTTKS